MQWCWFSKFREWWWFAIWCGIDSNDLLLAIIYLQYYFIDKVQMDIENIIIIKQIINTNIEYTNTKLFIKRNKSTESENSTHQNCTLIFLIWYFFVIVFLVLYRPSLKYVSDITRPTHKNSIYEQRMTTHEYGMCQ